VTKLEFANKEVLISMHYVFKFIQVQLGYIEIILMNIFMLGCLVLKALMV
jgi:hypothetical protein